MLAFILKCILTFIIDALECVILLAVGLMTIVCIIYVISRVSEIGYQKRIAPVRQEPVDDSCNEDPQPP
jgi:hypothetical protein